jgi:hypothetical protein
MARWRAAPADDEDIIFHGMQMIRDGRIGTRVQNPPQMVNPAERSVGLESRSPSTRSRGQLLLVRFPITAVTLGT